ncbi:triose-phosphate isomerase [Dubosiella newyorkensis]|uniref:triose-phosphate isomerase n=1 Tax=Dubosiella newyorkensis TaxID=1862672 RepID=UPI003F67B084
MKNIIIFGNWKRNKNNARKPQALEAVTSRKNKLNNLCVGASFTDFKNALARRKELEFVAAENVHFRFWSMFTCDSKCPDAENLDGVKYASIGHSRTTSNVW